MEYLYVLFAFVLCILGFLYVNDPARKYAHIPGPKRTSFLKGNNDDLLETPFLVHKAWAQKYGPIYKCFYGRYPVVFITSPELIHEVCITRFENFVNRSFSPGGVNTSTSILFARDEFWKRLRRSVTPAFNGIHLKPMIPMINKNVDVFVNLLEDSSINGNSLNIDESFSQITLQVIGSTAFGEDLSAKSEKNTKILGAVKDMMSAPDPKLINLFSILPEFFKLLVFKLIRRFPPKIAKHRVDARNHIFNTAAEIVKKKKNEGSSEGNFISALLNSQDKETGQHLSDAEIQDTSVTFLIAGHETTRHLCTMTIYITTQYPHVLAKMLEEIDTFYPGENIPTNFEDLKNLEYTSMVINEVLRLYPSVPLISRENNCDMELGGYKIPAHTGVFIPVYAIHTDPKIWGDDADLFKPERWLNPPQDQCFVPFGVGNRSCVGMRFALIEAKILLVRTFKKFTFKLVPGKNQIPPVIKEGTLTCSLRDGLFVEVIQRGKQTPTN